MIYNSVMRLLYTVEIYMFVHVPDHFSSHLEANFKKLPVRIVDRSSSIKSLLGCLFGFLLLGLGIFELFTFITQGIEKAHSFLTVEFFAAIVILIALGLIIYSVLALVRYKKVIFDGTSFTIIYRPAIGVKHQIIEPLDNYMGVRFRVLFAQSGLFNRNRYIIDLYHQDTNKIIPLYIATNNKNIRRIWESYARMFKLPALSVGDRGLVQRSYEDLDKSLQELHADRKLPFIASGKLPAPESLQIKETRNATIVEPAGIYWDVFSTLFLLIAISAILLLIAGGTYLTFIGKFLPAKYWIFGAILIVSAVYFAAKLFKSYRLDIQNDKIVVSETFGSSILTSDSINCSQIENIELSYNPIIDRYSVAIISDDKAINFGGRLPVNDLLWLKDFIIRKLIGN